jgi:hypothetical protein
MTELSPTAQAVKDAVLALYADKNVHKFGWQLDAPTVAAALRAAADQIAPIEHELINDCWYEKFNSTRKELLAIAAELEGR